MLRLFRPACKNHIGCFRPVPAVTDLVIRRSLRRRIGMAAWQNVFFMLPGLKSLSYEMWRNPIDWESYVAASK